MMLIIMFLIVTIVGFIVIKLDDGNFDFIGYSLITISCVCLILSIAAILLNNFAADLEIQNNRIEYEGLCKRLEIIESEYEDVSKSDVIADITAWNIRVYQIKYWSHNPWTNLFHPRCIADDLNYISLNGEEEKQTW